MSRSKQDNLQFRKDMVIPKIDHVVAGVSATTASRTIKEMAVMPTFRLPEVLNEKIKTLLASVKETKKDEHGKQKKHLSLEDLIAHVREMGDDLQRIITGVKFTIHPYDASNPKLYFGHEFWMMCVSAVPAGQMKPDTRQPGKPVPIVYAQMDRNSTVHWVKSNQQNVTQNQVNFHDDPEMIRKACKIRQSYASVS